MNTRNLIPVAALIMAGMAFSQDYTIDWYNIGGGVPESTTGGGYEIAGTIGRHDAATEGLGGGPYSLNGGFWVIPECPAIPADYDEDCDVDQADYTVFEVCASGPDVPHAVDCEYADLDGNGDVDQDDFAVFQQCLSGEGNPADPGCAD